MLSGCHSLWPNHEHEHGPRPIPVLEEMLLSAERGDERRIDQIPGGYFGLESSHLDFLLDRRDDAGIEYPAVEWERAAVLIVSGRSLPGIEADVLPQTSDAVVPILARVPDAPLIGAQKSHGLLRLVREPSLAGDENNVRAIGLN